MVVFHHLHDRIAGGLDLGLRPVFERLRARPAVNERFQLLLFADISIFLCLILAGRCPALARAAASDAQK
jgi:hypothetical protein